MKTAMNQNLVLATIVALTLVFSSGICAAGLFAQQMNMTQNFKVPGTTSTVLAADGDEDATYDFKSELHDFHNENGKMNISKLSDKEIQKIFNGQQAVCV